MGAKGWFVGLDLGFLDFLFVFSLGKTVLFSMCQVITSFLLQLSFWAYLKKKNASKMTWQLTTKSNQRCDLLIELNVGV